MPTERKFLAGKITKVPGVQCVVTTGVFVEKQKEQIDIIVASSEENEADLKALVQEAEKAIGRELRVHL